MSKFCASTGVTESTEAAVGGEMSRELAMSKSLTSSEKATDTVILLEAV